MLSCKINYILTIYIHGKQSVIWYNTPHINHTPTTHRCEHNSIIVDKYIIVMDNKNVEYHYCSCKQYFIIQYMHTSNIIRSCPIYNIYNNAYLGVYIYMQNLKCNKGILQIFVVIF